MIFKTIATMFVVILFLAPQGAANHWTVHDSEFDGSARETREDDGEVMQSGGATFVGRANRVTYPGSIPGDGSLFLDARLGNLVGADAARLFDLYPGAFAGDVVGNDNVLLPGITSASAWYGHWNDLNANGAIDDVHDAVEEAADEFVWRGKGDGVTTAMTFFVTPYDGVLGYKLGDPTNASEVQMVDGTARDNAVQEWVGRTSPVNRDGGFLATFQVFTVAGARAAIGGKIEFDLDDPAALYDVDTYTAVNNEVEALWTTAARTADDGRLTVLRAFWGQVDPVTATVGGMLPPLSTQGVTGLAFGLSDELKPWDTKEPNTEWDDFGGRTTFGGVGDAYGSHNQYDGYFDGYHFAHDTRGRLRACAGLFARVPGVGTEVSVPLTCQSSTNDPVASLVLGGRSTAAVLSFFDEVILWKDINKDGELGDKCDPDDPSQFDAERNICREPYHSRTKIAYYDANEVVWVCQFSDAVSQTIRVAPMGGDWPPGTVLVKDQRETTRVAFDTHWVPLTGDTPAILRWESACGGNGKDIHSRDVIVFAVGESTVPLRVDAMMSLASFRDLGLGIENGYEYALDVDVLAAVL